MRSQLIFAHVTTAVLSCHVQNFVVICLLQFWLDQLLSNQIWIYMSKSLVKI